MPIRTSVYSTGPGVRRHVVGAVAGALLLSALGLAAACSGRSPSAPAGVEPAKEPAAVKDPLIERAERAFGLMAGYGPPPEAAAGARAAFAAAPERFVALLNEALGEDARLGRILELVDKAHALPADYEPADLVSLNGYPLARARADLRLREPVMASVLAMDAEARAAGLKLVYGSSYRSYAYQEEVYARHVRQLGAAAADRVSARPGHSQHQLGTAIDFSPIETSFGATPEGRWLAENAWRFGFSLSYPQGYEAITGYDFEPWHYRYITKPGAALEREYFGGIQQYLMAFLRAFAAAGS